MYTHKTSKDYAGITVESLKVQGMDSWHHRNGYQHTEGSRGFYTFKEMVQITKLHIFF
jgi:hypothetical protein